MRYQNPFTTGPSALSKTFYTLNPEIFLSSSIVSYTAAYFYLLGVSVGLLRLMGGVVE